LANHAEDKTMEDAAVTAVLVVCALAAVWLAQSLFKPFWTKRQAGFVTVFQHEVGLKIEKGRVTGVLKAGRYATWPDPIQIERFDLRPRHFTVQGQEILTLDRLAVRVSITVGWKVIDAQLYREAHDNPGTRLYEIAQIALREKVAQLSLDEVAGDRGALQLGLAEALAPLAAPLSISIVSAEVKDVTLVGPAKQAYADLWKARKEGEAALERARSEQASLRSLANAARLLKGNPELMNLRVLQALAGRPGAPAPSVILGGAPGLVPVSKDAAPETSGEQTGE
jgi:SPFH domain / Band 7 family